MLQCDSSGLNAARHKVTHPSGGRIHAKVHANNAEGSSLFRVPELHSRIPVTETSES